mmetsp:Transcript_39908/g.55483  ORF Transcript_39908/g.55483 Transcript_39908/m.55483 type:complete len:280 (+) Transcript_39908:143-982(+)|eukprot:CAMPEP_0196581334 /NCGR_PEP_ID=MMETSP1081-20130531/33673_1 /TAXON_ID=36882 /ORGANISM="Pyramimonas amylifera, Strain CCMP720" /LENGTH=279 /DNA_ID=CAMNT_0041901533 /DNA_START=143 /DNA_END=982 /DNA_ORIENTATION=-
MDPASSIPKVMIGVAFGSLASIVFYFAYDSRRKGSKDAIVIRPPNPNWKQGDGSDSIDISMKMVVLMPEDVLGGCYPLVISAYVPRPIALVSTISKDGVVNLAPFSYSGAMSHDPPCICFSVCRKPGGVRKDTLVNIEDNGEMVIHIVNEWFVSAANHTCGNFRPEEDEMELAGLTSVPSQVVRPPRCLESAVHMECKLKHSYEVKNNDGKITATMILAEVVCFHVREDLLDTNDGKGPVQVKFEGYKPISRLGGNTYGTTSYIYDMPRPDRPISGRRV